MKHPFLKFFAIAITSTLLLSCGGDSEDDSTEGGEETAEEVGPTFESECTGENDITFKVDNYGFQYDSTYVDDTNIEVVRSTWEMVNDSVAELNLFNFEEGAEESPSNYNITATFLAKNGQKIGAAQYLYMTSEGDYSVSIKIINSLGKIYFNNHSGMSGERYVEINYADENGACGEFALEVDQPETTMYGHVVLKGAWKTVD